MNVHEKLLAVQSELKVPKNQKNSFGKYNYRSCEDILEEVKPILKKHDCVVSISDEIVLIGDRFYIKATATFTDIKDSERIQTTAFAREASDKKGMDDAQVTGATSSYARKYALNGLFCIDDTKDADTDEYQKQRPKKAPEPKNETCNHCKAEIPPYLGRNGTSYTSKESKEKMNGLCANCYRKQKEALEGA